MADAKINTCAACKHPIAGQFANVAGQCYHAHCFKCSNCKGDLSAGVYSLQNQLFCEPCYQDVKLPKCAFCKKPITPGKCVRARDKDYHLQCLICADCKKPIQSHEIYPVAGKIYCVNCHFARKIEAEANA